MGQTLDARLQRFVGAYSPPFDGEANHHLKSMLADAGYSKEEGSSMYRRMATREEHAVIDVFDTRAIVDGKQQCSYLQLDNLDEWADYREHKPTSIASMVNVVLIAGAGGGIGALSGFLGAKALDWVVFVSTIGMGDGLYEAVGTSVTVGSAVVGALVGSAIGISDYRPKRRQNNDFNKKYGPRIIIGKEAVVKALSSEK